MKPKPKPDKTVPSGKNLLQDQFRTGMLCVVEYAGRRYIEFCAKGLYEAKSRVPEFKGWASPEMTIAMFPERPLPTPRGNTE